MHEGNRDVTTEREGKMKSGTKKVWDSVFNYVFSE
jgi:hypothetical protein